MDLVPVNAFGRPVVLPSVANRDTLGVRQINDPREALIPASPLAAKNSADLRQANGPRQSSSSGDTREKDNETSDVKSRGRAPARHHAAEEGEEEGRGSSIDLTV